MKKYILIIAIAFASTNALAKAAYEGRTKSGEKCSINFALENENVSFFSKGDGFSFILSESNLRTALQRGQNPVVVEGGDGPVSASLALYFDDQARLTSAIYKQRFFLLPKTLVCQDLRLK